jgi:AbrB family looped-hinge helix DNA binding protein
MAVTTRLSSKGQVVIPVSARRALGWRSGETLAVEVKSGGDRALVLRARTPDDLEPMLAAGYAWLARQRRDLVAALHDSRRRSRARERRRR